jgi:hypothetical protein
LPHPRVAVLVGGDSRHHRFTGTDMTRFADSLTALAQTGVGLMMTASRRTPDVLRLRMVALAQAHGGFFWDGKGENPYVALLALADFVVVTADSFNMIGEAAATGMPVLVFEPHGGHPKLDTFLRALKTKGIVHAFVGRLEGTPYKPLNSTFDIANAIAQGVASHRRALGLADMPDGPERL